MSHDSVYYKVGILHDNDENCFIKNEEAFCSKIDTGEEMVLDPDSGMFFGFF